MINWGGAQELGDYCLPECQTNGFHDPLPERDRWTTDDDYAGWRTRSVTMAHDAYHPAPGYVIKPKSPK